MLAVDINSINELFLNTSTTLAEQQVKDEESTATSSLEDNREALTIIFNGYEMLREKLSVSLTEIPAKKDLMVLKDHLKPLYEVLQKEYKILASDKKLKKLLKSEIENLKVCISDLKEFLEDIEKRINPHPKIEKLLNEIVNY